MATFTKQKLSGSTDGKSIKISSNTGGAGNTVHTAVSGTTDFDEVWLYAYNSSASSVNLNVEFGGTTSPDNIITQSIPAQSGLYLIVPGLPLQNGGVVSAYASVVNVVTVYGFVNRIDQ
tara:strand:- start:345 stop:701 length:357 start_codon:yes stop_codon:yes gene_type:complete